MFPTVAMAITSTENWVTWRDWAWRVETGRGMEGGEEARMAQVEWKEMCLDVRDVIVARSDGAGARRPRRKHHMGRTETDFGLRVTASVTVLFTQSQVTASQDTLYLIICQTGKGNAEIFSNFFFLVN